MIPLVTPRVSPSGTNPLTLVQHRFEVMRLAGELLEAMERAKPNPQDYTPWGGSAPLQATEAWAERMDWVKQLVADVEMDAVKIALAAASKK